MYSYVSSKQVKPAKNVTRKFLSRARASIEEEYDIWINVVLVGSGKSNLVTRNGNEPFDLDFDIHLNEEILEEYTPKEIKNFIRKELDHWANDFDFSYGQDSSSVITYLHHFNGKNDFRVDIGIVVEHKGGPNKRLIHHKRQESYVFEQSRDYQQFHRYVKEINCAGENQHLRQVYLRKKNMALSSGKKVSSRSLYAEAVNEVYQTI